MTTLDWILVVQVVWFGTWLFLNIAQSERTAMHCREMTTLLSIIKDQVVEGFPALYGQWERQREESEQD